MRRLIRSLQQKPSAARDRIAFSIAAIFAALVCGVWLYHAPGRFGELALLQPEAEVEQGAPGFREQLAAIPSPFTNNEAVESSAPVSESGNASVLDTNETLTGEREQSRTTSADRNSSMIPASTVMSTTTNSSSSTAVASSTTMTTESSFEPRVVRIVTTPSASSTE